MPFQGMPWGGGHRGKKRKKKAENQSNLPTFWILLGVNFTQTCPLDTFLTCLYSIPGLGQKLKTSRNSEEKNLYSVFQLYSQQKWGEAKFLMATRLRTQVDLSGEVSLWSGMDRWTVLFSQSPLFIKIPHNDSLFCWHLHQPQIHKYVNLPQRRLPVFLFHLHSFVFDWWLEDIFVVKTSKRLSMISPIQGNQNALYRRQERLWGPQGGRSSSRKQVALLLKIAVMERSQSRPNSCLHR